MLGSLRLRAGTSTRFSTENSSSFAGKLGSDRNTLFVARNAVVCAAVAEAAPEVEERRKNSGRQAESLYEVLRVKRDASLREIKTAYRTLAKIYHPDVSAAAAAAAAAAMEDLDGKQFMEIHEAYATLSDPAARERYDSTLSASSRARRRPMTRYCSPDARARAGFYPTRRWETDQCW